jgi:hypothetical protein
MTHTLLTARPAAEHIFIYDKAFSSSPVTVQSNTQLKGLRTTRTIGVHLHLRTAADTVSCTKVALSELARSLAAEQIPKIESIGPGPAVKPAM